MMDNSMFNFIMDNAKKVFYPEEWLKLDLQLSKTELFSMLIIDRHGEIIMSQIADYVQIPMSTATSIVDRLVKKGLVKRGRSETDRRIVTITLSDKGSEMISNFKEQILKYVNRIDSVLSNEEKQLLINLISKILAVWNHDNIADDDKGSAAKIKKINID